MKLVLKPKISKSPFMRDGIKFDEILLIRLVGTGEETKVFGNFCFGYLNPPLLKGKIM
jgi:hypothetical protein